VLANTLAIRLFRRRDATSSEGFANIGYHSASQY
jgi:hypothetical protein